MAQLLDYNYYSSCDAKSMHMPMTRDDLSFNIAAQKSHCPRFPVPSPWLTVVPRDFPWFPVALGYGTVSQHMKLPNHSEEKNLVWGRRWYNYLKIIVFCVKMLFF